MKASELKVIFVSDAITDRNGVGTYYHDLVSYLSDRLAHAELIAPTMVNPANHQGLSFRIPGDQTQRLYFPKTRLLKSRFRKIRPDVVIFPTLGPYSILSVRHAMTSGAKICIGQHTDFERLADLCFHPWVAPTVRGVLQWLNRSLLRRSSMTVTNNPASVESLKPFGPVRVVGTPIPKAFVDQPTTSVSRKLQKVLFLGRLSPEKNIERLIEASEYLPNIQFLIGGDGPLRSQIEELSAVQPNIRCLGWLNRTQVMNVIDECDMLVLPSAVESFGTVAMEALLRERNAMVSESCGINQWHELASSLFVWRSDETLGEAIQRAADTDFESRCSLARQGREVAKRFNRTTIQQWVDVLEEIAEKTPSRRSNLRAAM